MTRIWLKKDKHQPRSLGSGHSSPFRACPPPLAAQLLVLQFDTGSTPTHLNCCDRKQLVSAIKSKRERNTWVAPRHLPGGVEKIPLHLPWEVRVAWGELAYTLKPRTAMTSLAVWCSWVCIWTQRGDQKNAARAADIVPSPLRPVSSPEQTVVPRAQCWEMQGFAAWYSTSFTKPISLKLRVVSQVQLINNC